MKKIALQTAKSPFKLNTLLEKRAKVDADDDSPSSYIHDANIVVKF